MVHWLRICLAMQGSPVRSLVQEDSVSLWATITEAYALGPVLCNRRSHCNEKPTHRSWKVPTHLLQLEKARAPQQRPSEVKRNKYFFKKK